MLQVSLDKKTAFRHLLQICVLQAHLTAYVNQMQKKTKRINISSIYGKSHRKFAASFFNSFILMLHSGFQHPRKPESKFFNHKRFPHNKFPLFVEVKYDVDETTRIVEFNSFKKGKKQSKIERYSVNLWKRELIPVSCVKTVKINGKSVKILSTEEFIPSWLK